MVESFAKEIEEHRELMKAKEVDMGEKKFPVGTIVRITEGRHKGRIGSVVKECPWYREVWLLEKKEATTPGLNCMEEIGFLKSQLTGAELAEVFDDYCESAECYDCPLEDNILDCEGDTVKNVLKNYDALVKEISRKEQEKKEVFKPGDIAIDTRDGELVEVVSELSHKTRQRNAIWLNREGYKLGYRLVCKAEDRVDGVKQD